MKEAQGWTVQQSIEQHSKSFALASKLLPPVCRHDAQVLYAWCRHADDAVDDEEVDKATLAQRLDGLRLELTRMYSGEALSAQNEPLLAACAEVVQRRAVPREYLDALVDGMAMDVHDTPYPDSDALLRYCYRVAGTVGLMMCHVMGVRRPEAVVHGAHLGIAMQLTNIARDVLEDWARGRLYLPDGLLARHGAAGLRGQLGQPFPPAAAEPVARATAALLACADDYYASGDAGLRDLSVRCSFGVRTARLVYSDIGARVRAQGCNPLAGRAYVSTGRKLWLTSGALLRTAGLVPSTLWLAQPQAPRGSVQDPASLLQLSRVQEIPLGSPLGGQV